MVTPRRVSCPVKTKVVIAYDVDQKPRRELPADLLRRAQEELPIHGTAEALRVPVNRGRKQFGVEIEAGVVFRARGAPRTECVTKIDHSEVPHERVHVDHGYGASVGKQEIGDLEISVDDPFWLERRAFINDERRQLVDNPTADLPHRSRELIDDRPKLADNKRRVVEVRDTSLRFVVELVQMPMLTLLPYEAEE